MSTRRLFAVVLMATAFGLAAFDGPAQDPKKDKDAKVQDPKDKDKEKEKKEDPKDKEKREKDLKANIEKVKPVEETFQTADGVKLRGVYYDAVNPKGGPAKAPVILMLHAYNQNPDEAVWDDTAKLIAAYGYHVFRFDFRGHGKSRDIVGRDFWDPRMPWQPINKAFIKGSDKAATKVTIDVKEFNVKYYPMLINDIAAARTQLDKKNDAGQLNSSSIYLLAAGDAVNLGMCFLASEWKRERKRPNADIINLFVTPRRELFPGFEPAGPDIRGAIWLGPVPAPSYSQTISNDDIKRWVMSPYALDLRMETQMLFLYGSKDDRAKTMTNTLFDNVLKILDPRDKRNKDRKMSHEGKQLPNPDQSFKQAVEGTNLGGAKLLGNNLGTERYIEAFILKVEEDRRNRERAANRGWDKPLYVDVGATGFGLVR